MSTYTGNLSWLQKVESGDTLLVDSGNVLHPQVSEDNSQLYEYGAPISLKGKKHVTLRGLGFPEIRFDAHGSGLLIQDCEDVLVEGITFRGMGVLAEDKPW